MHGFGGFCLETVNETLQMRPARLLFLGLGLQNHAAFGDLTGELVVRAGPIGQLFRVKMQDAGDGAVQEAAVVADDDDGVGIFLQIAFQPQRAFKVKVVGRLVQEQVIGLGEQDAGKGDAHAPAAGKV